MGWGTNIKNVYISRMSKQTAESDLSDERDMLRMLREELMILAASTPRDTTEELWVDFVRRRVTEITDGIEESAIKTYQCGLLIDADNDELESE